MIAIELSTIHFLSIILLISLQFRIFLVTGSAQDGFGLNCTTGKPASKKDGLFTATRIGSNSKFVFITGAHKELSFEKLSQVCKNWGLGVAQIKHPKDLKVISVYLQSVGKSVDNDGATFWVSGTDEGHEGKWVYSLEDIIEEYLYEEEEFYYHAFWGYSPMNFPTHKSHQSADNVQLHWIEDVFSGKRSLVMMDVENPNKFYKNQSIICQYKKDSECFAKSDEEKLFQGTQEKKDTVELLGELDTNRTIYVSFVQKTMQEALNICEKEGKQLLNLELESEAQSRKLFTLVSEWIIKNELNAGVTGFWVGNNDLFSPISAIQWEWVDSKIRSPESDKVLMYMKLAVREGPIPPPGQCLAIGMLQKEGNAFNLQRVPCELPQWVLCTVGEEAAAGLATARPPPSLGRSFSKLMNKTTEDPSSTTTPSSTEPTTASVQATTISVPSTTSITNSITTKPTTVKPTMTTPKSKNTITEKPKPTTTAKPTPVTTVKPISKTTTKPTPATTVKPTSKTTVKPATKTTVKPAGRR